MRVFNKEKKCRIKQDFYYLKSCFSLGLFFLTLCTAYAQIPNQLKIDSISSLLSNSRVKDRAGLYYQLAELYVPTDSSKAIGSALKGLDLSQNQNDLYHIGKGNFALGGIYLDYNYPLKAEARYRSADSVLSKLIQKDSSAANLKLWVRANFNISVALSYQGINEDIEYLEKITPVAEKIGFNRILAIANTNLGISFFNSGQLEKAYQYFKNSGKKYEEMKDYNTFLEDRFMFVSCLVEMDSLKTAKKVLTKIESIMDTVPDRPKKQMYHLVNGQYHSGAKEYDKAIINFKKAENLLSQSQIIRNNLQLQLDFMEAYGEMEDYNNAILRAENCLQLVKLNKNKVIEAEVYKQLSKYHSQIGNSPEAYFSLFNYVKISDSLNIAERDKEVSLLETKYQSEKKEREILQLKNDNDTVELQLTKKQSQNYFLLSISMGLLVLTGFAYLGYRNFRKKDKLKTAEINQLKYEQESKVYSAMLEGQENERKRLAIDLHDGLAGRLSATRIKLEKLAKKSESKKTEKDFKEAASYIDNSLTELRGIAMNLMPETLFKYGLKNAIEDYCSSIGSGLDDVKFILQFYDTEKVLPKNVALTIYRIIQELINNAVKHSRASEVLVQYLVEKEKINITVEDNGEGFSLENLKEKRGMGLENLKTRVAYLNGEIDFDSNPGEGTNINIVINL